MQSRRDFIKKSCTLCMGLAAAGIFSAALSSCSPLPIYKEQPQKGFITVPLSMFNEKAAVVILRNSKLDYDIALVKKSDGSFTALFMKCTHQDNPLTATSSGLFCSAHGSEFDLNGNVTKEPALLPLKNFPVSVKDGFVLVDIR